MKIPLSVLGALAGYFVWSTTFADATAGIVAAVGF